MAHRVKMELSMSNNKAQSSISMENTADEMLYLVDDGSPEFAQAEHEAVVVVGDPCQSHITKNAFQRLSRQFDLRKKSARAPPTSDHVGVPVREKKIFQVKMNYVLNILFFKDENEMPFLNACIIFKCSKRPNTC